MTLTGDDSSIREDQMFTDRFTNIPAAAYVTKANINVGP